MLSALGVEIVFIKCQYLISPCLLMRQSGSRCAVTVALVMPCGGTFRILSSDGVPLARVSRKHRCSKGERSGGQGLVPCPLSLVARVPGSRGGTGRGGSGSARSQLRRGRSGCGERCRAGLGPEPPEGPSRRSDWTLNSLVFFQVLYI